MKQKTSLTLMELLLMVLVFAMASAICLRAFALSQRISLDNEKRNHALLLVQNAAEELKSRGTQPQRVQQYYDENWAQSPSGPYRLEILPQKEEIPGLCRAYISLEEAESGKEIFGLTAAWQEVRGK